EHWQRVARTQYDWHQTQRAVVEQLEALTADLPRREQALLTRQQAVEAAEGVLRARQQDLSRLRQHVEGRAARLHLSEMAWQGERARLLTELRGRAELSEKHLHAVVDLRQRWSRRR